MISKAVLSVYRVSGDSDTLGYESFCVSTLLGPWSDTGITYKTEPLHFPDKPAASASSSENNTWIYFDVTDTIRQFCRFPEKNFGFMLGTYVVGRAIAVCSSEFSQSALRPKLTIIYDTAVVGVIRKNQSSDLKKLKIRSTKGSFSIFFPDEKQYTVSIYSISGKKILSQIIRGKNCWQDHDLQLKSGAYLITVAGPSGKARSISTK